MNLASRSVKNFQDVCALSGKSTKSQYATIPRKQVKAPSMMKILEFVRDWLWFEV